MDFPVSVHVWFLVPVLGRQFPVVYVLVRNWIVLALLIQAEERVVSQLQPQVQPIAVSNLL